MKLNKYHTYILCLFVFINLQAQNNSFDRALDSIHRLRKLCKNESINLNSRLKYAKEASRLSYKTKVDSTILLSNRALVGIYMIMDNIEMIRAISHKNLKLARKLNDSTIMAHTYRNLAWSYIGPELNIDSCYIYSNTALKLYRKLKDYEYQSLSLSYISHLQKNEQDFVNSNANLIKAINLLKLLPEDDGILDGLISYYHQIGLNSKASKLYDEAIEYFNKALEINNKLSDNYDYDYKGYNGVNKYMNYLYTKLNLAEVYRLKKDYKKALSIHDELLKDKDLSKKDPGTYVTLINNKAYTLFTSKSKETKHINSLFRRAYKISDSLNDLYKIVVSGNDLAEFLYAINKKDSAHILSKKSYTLGKQIRNHHEVSRALMLLSKIEKGENSKKHLYEHIKLNDSLLDVERTSRNKFARIQYETDTYIDETKRLTSQNILIIIIGLIIILVFALILIIRIQITKNRVLRFEGEQQKANEEIYTLMLRQQAKIEEGRLLERHHISEELHDGILNKLLGSRLGLEFLVIDEKNKEKNKEKFNIYIEEIRTIEKEIRDLSHELKNTKLDAEKDFITIMKNYVDYQSNLHAFQYNLSHNPNILWENIDDYVKVNLYRIIQEAIQNIVKHAKATTITINFLLNSNKLYLDIIDNGIGFNINKKNNGIGLLNIKSRASKIKGELKINSKSKEGTTLTVKLPFYQTYL
ncbi:ATP-binding protein [Flavivirga eckloniae]|uniref:histidine kinase n=1 Tax=Flavivirga eckloniae TaxID=1803846 RepID=A0A2K9PLA3_9FLAO|nr:tetratricopeptide repeat-containing sensor histidine kinase [Flavivirga eckloniae]AUP77805.1 hypothetical protein C1H87_03370 [Flavivirga eckloniae]